MDELLFLLLSKIADNSKITFEGLIAFHSNSASLGHYTWEQVLDALQTVQQADLVTRSRENGEPYSLSPKGMVVLQKEMERRAVERKRHDFQEQLSESTLSANQSVIDTNQSVQRTNDWMIKNARRQNWLTIGNMTISLSAFLVAALALFKSYQDTRREREQAANKKTLQQLQILDNFLKHPDKQAADSVLLELLKD